MSSEEVAELAQAITDHADALYESWTKGQEAMNMKRMEDTLELLADPGLTPKLEHLVSSFVRRDKAKRQFHSQVQPQRQQKSPPKSLDPQDIPQNEREPSPGSFNRKALPKSILAVVQRFEQPASMDISRERSPSSMFAPSNHSSMVAENNNSAISRNAFWAESNNRHQSERKVGRVSSPALGTSTSGGSTSPPAQNSSSSGSGSVGANKLYNSVHRSYSPSPSPVESSSPVVVGSKERHIPIERYDNTNGTPNTPIPQIVKANGYSSSPKPKSLPNTQQQPLPIKTQSPVLSISAPGATGTTFKNEMRELEREEERLFHALRTGQVVTSGTGGFSSQHSPTQSVPPDSGSPRGSLPTGADSSAGSPTNGYSRVAFAKERIRQSQQHPLTQQRLELQKRLPSPSGSLAAAIAVQQGKLKFQPAPVGSPNGSAASSPLSSPSLPVYPSPLDEEGNGGKEQYTGGYHSRFNGFRFGPGSSVADRVQMFEKYPSATISLCAHPHSGSGTPPPQSTSPTSPPSRIALSQGPLSVVDAGASISSIVATRKQQLQQQPVSVSSATAPWRCSSPNGRDVTDSGFAGTTIPSTNVNSLAPGSCNGTQQPYHHQLFQIHIDTSASGIPKGQSARPKTPVDSPRGSKRSASKDVPRFYFPKGKPETSPNILQETLAVAEEEMRKHNGRVAYNEFSDLLSAVGVPIFWKKPFWMAMGLAPDETLSPFTFIPFLRNLFSDCPDETSRFARLLNAASKSAQLASNNNNNNINNNNNNNSPSKYGGLAEVFKQDVKTIELGMSDFVPMIQDIIDTHQGLGFLRDAPEFHSRYITTVVSRIFYKANRSWSGRLTLSELRRSNLLMIIKRLEEETDINNVTEYFSYEHFYVIYCKFWELDKDHDLLIDKTDLRGHADHALSSRIIERIFSGTVLRGWDMTSSVRAPTDKMTYSDFVWFLLSEEDKKTPTAIEYWFRCLDLDGDGVLSPFELQYFYCEQETRIEALGIEPLDFSNVYCQVVDMLQCPTTGIRLKDFKRNPQLAANVFNTLFNLDKYLEHEQRDPFAAAASGANNLEGIETESDWDKYAAAEYELLIAEETPSDHMHNSDLEETTSPT